jgi:hypothetical protein
VTHRDTPSNRRRRRRRTKKVKEILENGLVVAAIALVVGLLVFAFNPLRAGQSQPPVPEGKLLRP